jgi:hypothetical protein
MALFGFAVTLGLILASYLLSGDSDFSAPFGLGLGFILTYYFFALTFFVIFTVSAAAKMRSVHAGRPTRWFALSFLSFSIGSVLGALAFLVFLAFAFSRMNPVF